MRNLVENAFVLFHKYQNLNLEPKKYFCHITQGMENREENKTGFSYKAHETYQTEFVSW